MVKMLAALVYQMTDRWKNRRRMVWGTFIWCLSALTYLMVVGGDDEVHKSVIGTIGMVLPLVLGSYFGAATWDDKGK